jgi:hypothetical protein
MARKHSRRVTRSRKTRRGGGLGSNTATWPPDNTSFGRFAGSPLNADNLEFEKSPKGGKRRKTKRRSLKRK